MKEQTNLFLSLTLLQAVVFIIVESQTPTALPTPAVPTVAVPTGQPNGPSPRFQNRGAALAIAIIILILIVCCCCGCCFRNQIKARYEAFRYGGAAAGGGQQEVGNYPGGGNYGGNNGGGNYGGNYPGGTMAAAPVMPVVAHATISPGGQMVFGPDGKPV